MVKNEMIEYELKGPQSQALARAHLVSALTENRFPQAVIIEGAKGIGKKTLAIQLAQALCCTDSHKRPCGHCFGCKMAVDPGNVDCWVIPLETKEANAKSAADVSAGSVGKTVEDYLKNYVTEIIRNPYSVDYLSSVAQISVEQIRNTTSRFALTGDRVRFVIVAEAERMNDSAANAFLKTLEEVPPNTYFILTTSSRERLLQTIRSRCLSLRLPALEDREVQEIVVKITGETVSPDVLGMALGSPGKAMYYALHESGHGSFALDFLRCSVEENYSELFFAMETEDLKDPDEACVMLHHLSFLIADVVRQLAGAPARAPQAASALKSLRLENWGATALQMALLTIEETIEKVVGRKNTPTVALQTLAIQLFEGYK
jgi:DNA polymerase-3 subunit delta'